MSMIRGINRGQGHETPAVTLAADPDAMTRVVAGMEWFGVDDGKAVYRQRCNPLPPLKDDDAVLPFFSGGAVRKLCGYNWSPENYASEAARLESFGFECLRSRRSERGTFWEHWVLPGVWAAKGRLKEEFDSWPKPACDANSVQQQKAETDAVVRWLAKNCSFGSLDVVVQRLSMTMD